jgi:hypothetical protein
VVKESGRRERHDREGRRGKRKREKVGARKKIIGGAVFITTRI